MGSCNKGDKVMSDNEKIALIDVLTILVNSEGTSSKTRDIAEEKIIDLIKSIGVK